LNPRPEMPAARLYKFSLRLQVSV